MSKMLWRYVEVSYELPDKDQTQFFATVDESESPNVALLTAIEMCVRRHPEATEIEEFMQRVITPERSRADQGSVRGRHLGRLGLQDRPRQVEH